MMSKPPQHEQYGTIIRTTPFSDVKLPYHRKKKPDISLERLNERFNSVETMLMELHTLSLNIHNQQNELNQTQLEQNQAISDLTEKNADGDQNHQKLCSILDILGEDIQSLKENMNSMQSSLEQMESQWDQWESFITSQEQNLQAQQLQPSSSYAGNEEAEETDVLNTNEYEPAGAYSDDYFAQNTDLNVENVEYDAEQEAEQQEAEQQEAEYETEQNEEGTYSLDQEQDDWEQDFFDPSESSEPFWEDPQDTLSQAYSADDMNDMGQAEKLVKLEAEIEQELNNLKSSYPSQLGQGDEQALSYEQTNNINGYDGWAGSSYEQAPLLDFTDEPDTEEEVSEEASEETLEDALDGEAFSESDELEEPEEFEELETDWQQVEEQAEQGPEETEEANWEADTKENYEEELYWDSSEYDSEYEATSSEQLETEPESYLNSTDGLSDAIVMEEEAEEEEVDTNWEYNSTEVTTAEEDTDEMPMESYFDGLNDTESEQASSKSANDFESAPTNSNGSEHEEEDILIQQILEDLVESSPEGMHSMHSLEETLHELAKNERDDSLNLDNPASDEVVYSNDQEFLPEWDSNVLIGSDSRSDPQDEFSTDELASWANFSSDIESPEQANEPEYENDTISDFVKWQTAETGIEPEEASWTLDEFSLPEIESALESSQKNADIVHEPNISMAVKNTLNHRTETGRTATILSSRQDITDQALDILQKENQEVSPLLTPESSHLGIFSSVSKQEHQLKTPSANAEKSVGQNHLELPSDPFELPKDIENMSSEKALKEEWDSSEFTSSLSSSSMSVLMDQDITLSLLVDNDDEFFHLSRDLSEGLETVPKVDSIELEEGVPVFNLSSILGSDVLIDEESSAILAENQKEYETE